MKAGERRHRRLDQLRDELGAARWDDVLSFRTLWRDQAPAYRRHLPFFVLVSIAGVIVAFLPFLVVSWPGVLAALVLAALTAVLAIRLPWDRWPYDARVALALSEFAVVGLLRSATGGPTSVFGSLLFLPAITLSAERGRRPVYIATVAATAVVAVPMIVGDAPVDSPAMLVRVAWLPLVVLVAGLTVNALTSRLRRRTAALEQVRASEHALLEKSRADAQRIAHAAERLKTSLGVLEGVIESVTGQAIIGTDDAGRVEVFNAGAEDLLAVPRRDVIGRRNIVDWVLASEVAAAGGGFEALVQDLDEPEPGTAPRAKDWTWLRPDGTQRTVQVTATRRTDATGARRGVLFVAADRTEEREATRLKDEFVSLISHELRTPLSSILGYLELVLDEETGDPLTDDQRDYLSIVERNANRLLRLVGDLLFTAQVEAGRWVIDRKALDVVDLVRVSIRSARPSAEVHRVAMRLIAPEEPIVIEADALRLAQALDNLVSNAIKFTPGGGEVEVEVRHGTRKGETGEDAPTVVIVVRDTGIGIPEDEVDHLFARFFRATTATRAVVPGTGLGLSITKAVVTAHGGELVVQSKVGQGTSFAVVLPATAPPDPQTSD